MLEQDQTETLLSQNATLALSLNWMRRQVELSRGEGDLPPGILGEAVLRDRQQEKIEEQAREICLLTEKLETGSAVGNIAADLDGLRAYVVELERRHLSVLQSTSWQLTAPLRWIARRLRGAPPPNFEPQYLSGTARDDP